MKKYKILKTKKLFKQLKPYWLELEELETNFYAKVNMLEKKMQKETGIRDIEFFMCDGNYVGIGNFDKTMELIHGEEL